jgi:hypothetical protein
MAEATGLTQQDQNALYESRKRLARSRAARGVTAIQALLGEDDPQNYRITNELRRQARTGAKFTPNQAAELRLKVAKLVNDHKKAVLTAKGKEGEAAYKKLESIMGLVKTYTTAIASLQGKKVAQMPGVTEGERDQLLSQYERSVGKTGTEGPTPPDGLAHAAMLLGEGKGTFGDMMVPGATGGPGDDRAFAEALRLELLLHKPLDRMALFRQLDAISNGRLTPMIENVAHAEGQDLTHLLQQTEHAISKANVVLQEGAEAFYQRTKSDIHQIGIPSLDKLIGYLDGANLDPEQAAGLADQIAQEVGGSGDEDGEGQFAKVLNDLDDDAQQHHAAVISGREDLYATKEFQKFKEMHGIGDDRMGLRLLNKVYRAERKTRRKHDRQILHDKAKGLQGFREPVPEEDTAAAKMTTPAVTADTDPNAPEPVSIEAAVTGGYQFGQLGEEVFLLKEGEIPVPVRGEISAEQLDALVVLPKVATPLESAPDLTKPWGVETVTETPTTAPAAVAEPAPAQEPAAAPTPAPPLPEPEAPAEGGEELSIGSEDSAGIGPAAPELVDAVNKRAGSLVQEETNERRMTGLGAAPDERLEKRPRKLFKDLFNTKKKDQP